MARDNKGKAPASAGANSPPSKEADTPKRNVRVRAVRLGYYGNPPERKRPKAIFDVTLAEGESIPSWTEPVGRDVPAGPAPRVAPPPPPETTLSQLGQKIAPSGVSEVVI